MKKSNYILVLVAIIISASVWITRINGTATQGDYYDIKLQAAEHMEQMMAQIIVYREELGLVINPDDLHQTGMIGLPFTYPGITTTVGALESKRTTANPDMAALVVQLMVDAGISSGDRVGAGFSGSFPAMNLAVLAAGQAMGVEVIYIASVGASTYGANQPELTFPDMVYRLTEDGLINNHSIANTLGGHLDAGLDLDPTLRVVIEERLYTYPSPLIIIEDYEKNIATRMELYGDIDIFIGVGGNMTTLGRGEVSLLMGIIPPYSLTDGEGSGLLARYSAKGLPVISLLDIKRLVADYGLAYDPVTWPPMGTTSIYYEKEYPIIYGVVSLGIGVILLLNYRKIKQREDMQ